MSNYPYNTVSELDRVYKSRGNFIRFDGNSLSLVYCKDDGDICEALCIDEDPCEDDVYIGWRDFTILSLPYAFYYTKQLSVFDDNNQPMLYGPVLIGRCVFNEDDEREWEPLTHSDLDYVFKYLFIVEYIDEDNIRYVNKALKVVNSNV